MGTNFYWSPEGPCESCGHEPEALHIGKSSMGWCFSLAVHPDEGINGLEDWQECWRSGVIRDEYGEELSPEKMLRRITRREGRGVDSAFCRENGAVPGPNGLARHSMDAQWSICVGHGEGTWDLLRGEFS